MFVTSDAINHMFQWKILASKKPMSSDCGALTVYWHTWWERQHFVIPVFITRITIIFLTHNIWLKPGLSVISTKRVSTWKSHNAVLGNSETTAPNCSHRAREIYLRQCSQEFMSATYSENSSWHERCVVF